MVQHEQKPLKEALAPILDVLGQLGGKFTFMDDEGRQFVLASADALEDEEALREAQGEQLSLPQADSVARAIRKHVDSSLADDVIERVNRDIALAASVLEQADDIEEVLDAEDATHVEVQQWPTPPPLRSTNGRTQGEPRIRFEPIKGDLPPDLQE